MNKEYEKVKKLGDGLAEIDPILDGRFSELL